jgi:glucans biosynthesis protein
LKGQARALAAQPYKSHSGELPKEVAALDWDQYQALQLPQRSRAVGRRRGASRPSSFILGLFFKSRCDV